MKVFISWSGTTSRAVAEALTEWFPKVIQGIRPFLSAKDIDKGANWTVELARELSDAEFGIICLASDNLKSPWLNYEAGAITRSVNSRVCPILFHVDKGDVQPPLAQLQLTTLDQDDVFQLMQSMNKVSGAILSDATLREAVGVWWPMLEKKLGEIPVPASVDPDMLAVEPAKPQVDQNEMLEEVLHRMRSLDSRFYALENRRTSNDFSKHRPDRIRESESPTTAPSDVRHEVYMSLMALADARGLNSTKGTITEEGVDIHVANNLPDVLDYEFSSEVSELAKKHGARIRFSAPNRQVAYEKDGSTKEPPF